MKKYKKPEIEVIKLAPEDIIKTSGEITEEAPKIMVDGVKAEDYGAHDFSIFNIFN